jgi:hypothetical protein
VIRSYRHTVTNISRVFSDAAGDCEAEKLTSSAARRITLRAADSFLPSRHFRPVARNGVLVDFKGMVDTFPLAWRTSKRPQIPLWTSKVEASYQHSWLSESKDGGVSRTAARADCRSPVKHRTTQKRLFMRHCCAANSIGIGAVGTIPRNTPLKRNQPRNPIGCIKAP